jgi:hypothetical protein
VYDREQAAGQIEGSKKAPGTGAYGPRLRGWGKRQSQSLAGFNRIGDAECAPTPMLGIKPLDGFLSGTSDSQTDEKRRFGDHAGFQPGSGIRSVSVAMIRRTTASRRCRGEICHAMSKPSGILQSTVKISAVSTSPVLSLLRLEKASDPTVSFSRIINCARLTARRASGHSIASPGEKFFSTRRNETATYRLVQGLWGSQLTLIVPLSTGRTGSHFSKSESHRIDHSEMPAWTARCGFAEAHTRAAFSSRILCSAAAQAFLGGQKRSAPAGYDRRRGQSRYRRGAPSMPLSSASSSQRFRSKEKLGGDTVPSGQRRPFRRQQTPCSTWRKIGSRFRV